jgi:hypothetical protein
MFTLNQQIPLGGGGYMMKRIFVTALLAVFILVPALAAMDVGERDIFEIGTPTQISDNEIMVPIMVTHDEDLVAMDIPLEYSSGVTLTDISFVDTRVDYFDAKMSYIEEDNNRAVIGLVSMLHERKSALDPGKGVIANLTFRIDDLGMTEFTIKPFESDEPRHSLSLIYNDISEGTPYVRSIHPEFEGGTVYFGNAAPILPTVFELDQNYPNPFNPDTDIWYALPDAAYVELDVYNILGQKVISLVNEHREAGRYKVTWEGVDSYGTPVASGVYFYRINAGEFKDIKKMVLMK